jgi:CheY-like chemotaxis protein
VNSKKQNILIVDDDRDMRDVISTALAGAGYKTILADDGTIALDLFFKHHPDLIVSDIYMPNMNGIELLKEVKKSSPSTPVILITGYSQHDAFDEAKDKVTPDALLRKPFSLKDLRLKIDSLI